MFKGKYYKHQNNGNSLCLIVGKADSGQFLQVATNDEVLHFDDFSACSFSDKGVYLDLPDVKGEIVYSNLTPLKSDIMGFFRFFPLQCRHYVYSMHHNLNGVVSFKGKFLDFNGGKGYTEGDKGSSFPKKYLWVHCNDFAQKCSIMASVADIPFAGFNFQGCICAVVYQNTEYRLATYNGAKVEKLTPNQLTISTKKLRLEVQFEGEKFVPLKMPIKGQMSAITHECNAAYAHFRFFENGNLLFDHTSNNASIEYIL